MKNILSLLTLVILMFLVSCAREADIIDAPTSYLESEVIGLQAFDSNAGAMDSQVRAITLLFYPRPEHIGQFGYEITDLSRASWDSVLSTFSYADRVVTEYSPSMSADFKVQKMVSLIQSVGRSRDNAWRSMYPLNKRMDAIGAKKVEIKEAIENAEPDISWKDYICYYKDKPSRGENYDCRTIKDDEYKKRKRPRGCDDILTFDFIYSTPEDETNFEAVITECKDVNDILLAYEEELTVLDEEFDSLITKFTPLENIRKSGEGVVLDLLQSAERFTKKEGYPQVYVATGSSLEKPNNQDIISEVIINFDRDAVNPVEKFSLWIEFGLNYSGGTPSQEYSIENGRIQDFSLTWAGENPTMNFKLVTDDFWIECALDVTNDDYEMGYRAVGEVFAHYPDGSQTRGGMKLEFNIIEK